MAHHFCTSRLGHRHLHRLHVWDLHPPEILRPVDSIASAPRWHITVGMANGQNIQATQQVRQLEFNI